MALTKSSLQDTGRKMENEYERERERESEREGQLDVVACFMLAKFVAWPFCGSFGGIDFHLRIPPTRYCHYDCHALTGLDLGDDINTGAATS